MSKWVSMLKFVCPHRFSKVVVAIVLTICYVPPLFLKDFKKYFENASQLHQPQGSKFWNSKFSWCRKQYQDSPSLPFIGRGAVS